MRHPILTVLSATAIAALAPAQGFSFLFSTSQQEQTLSGSGGTNLRDLRPHEVTAVEFFPCPITSAEKWAPLSCYQTMAGDENSDAMYFDPTLFGSIDALLEVISPVALSNQRSVFWSVAAPMGTGVSGLPGFRPGDTARIVRNSSGDGKVQYFLRAELVQLALGMPISPVVVDVDAIAASPNYGVFFSLDQDTVVNTTCGVTFVRDGDLLMIPASAITWTADLRVQNVVPNSAHVVYPEAQMNLFVQNANVANRTGACVNLIQDLEGLEIDFAGPVVTFTTCPGTISTIPALLFTGELLTGASVLTTAGGGQIYVAGCGPLGTSCGSGPTMGFQMGLLPPGLLGVQSYVSALTHAFPRRFVMEPRQHVFNFGNPAVIDIYTPGTFNVIFAAFAPTGINAVAPSISFANMMFPDLYVNNFIYWSPTGLGFTTHTSPNIPWPCKLVWQSAAIVGSQVVLSTPITTDVL